MARRIIWSKRAQLDRKSILAYWNKRNKSRVYSKKLNNQFIRAIDLIAFYPQTGGETSNKQVRTKFIAHYAIIYSFSSSSLTILAIFDTRQNPDKLKNIIQ